MMVLCVAIVVFIFMIGVESIYAEPIVFDDNYKIEKVVEGLEYPSSIVFLDDKMFVAELSSGKIFRVLDNGVRLPFPMLELPVAKEGVQCECGLLGMTSKGNELYVYYTEYTTEVEERKNKIVKFRFDGTWFVDPKIVTEVPGFNLSHHGGAITTGLEEDVYFVVGDQGVQQNAYVNFPTDYKLNVGSIFKIKDEQIEHFAMGIRNSYGLAVDPETGFLWQTENGPNIFDEINLVKEKFNGGWNVLSGPTFRIEEVKTELNFPKDFANQSLDLSRINYEDYEYSEPKFTWKSVVGPTAIEFPNSEFKYSDYLFVGDFHTGTIYKFKLNIERDGFVFKEKELEDTVLDGNEIIDEIFFVKEISGGVVDLTFNHDGMYAVSIFEGMVYKISEKAVLTPTEQYNAGVLDRNIKCKQNFWPIMKNSGSIACVTPKTALILEKQGWSFNHPNMPIIRSNNQEIKDLDLENQNLSEVDFRGVKFENVTIGNVDFRFANFAYADLSNIDFNEAVLTGADLGGADLRGADLSGAHIVMSNLKNTDLSVADLSGANLRGADLRGADLRGADLSGVDLSGADLTGADLSNVVFQGADLSNVNLSGVDLTGANLSGVDFSGVDLTMINFRGVELNLLNLTGVDLSNVNLSEANLSGVDLRDTNLQGANLRGVDLSGEDLSGVDLSGLVLSESDLTGADLSGADLSGVDLTGADLTGANLTGADLTGVDLTNVGLQKAILREVDLSGVDFSGANLSNVSLRDTNLQGADLRGVDLSGAELTGADLSEVVFQGADLSNVSLRGADLTGADFRGADLTGADLTNVGLQKAILRGADLSGADFRGADLSNVNLRDTSLQGANLSGANLSGANLTRADLTGADLTDADLTNVGLQKAILRGADLTGADLSGADLTGADISNTKLNCINHPICE